MGDYKQSVDKDLHFIEHLKMNIAGLKVAHFYVVLQESWGHDGSHICFIWVLFQTNWREDIASAKFDKENPKDAIQQLLFVTNMSCCSLFICITIFVIELITYALCNGGWTH